MTPLRLLLSVLHTMRRLPQSLLCVQIFLGRTRLALLYSCTWRCPGVSRGSSPTSPTEAFWILWSYLPWSANRPYLSPSLRHVALLFLGVMIDSECQQGTNTFLACRSYFRSCSRKRWSLAGAWCSGLLKTDCRGLWSVSTATVRSYTNWWNFSHPNTTASGSFSLCVVLLRFGQCTWGVCYWMAFRMMTQPRHVRLLNWNFVHSSQLYDSF